MLFINLITLARLSLSHTHTHRHMDTSALPLDVMNIYIWLSIELPFRGSTHKHTNRIIYLTIWMAERRHRQCLEYEFWNSCCVSVLSRHAIDRHFPRWIRPKFGVNPLPPPPAFQQFIHGVLEQPFSRIPNGPAATHRQFKTVIYCVQLKVIP